MLQIKKLMKTEKCTYIFNYIIQYITLFEVEISNL